ncbi:hypothetical protein ACFL1H_07275 [Nanoarchaeota archaeon]
MVKKKITPKPNKTLNIVVTILIILGILALAFGFYRIFTLESSLRAAYDVTGTWSGSASWTDNVANPNCRYMGYVELSLTHYDDGTVDGYGTFYISSSQKLLQTSSPCVGSGSQYLSVWGTVSSTQIGLESNVNVDFFGSYTSNLMSFEFQSCPNQYCKDGSIGPGIKGTTKLTR